MRVFISSVTYALRHERQGLVRILEVVEPYEPLVFEQFTSQDRSSRDTCLAGVDACDVCALLLGPGYGDPLPDSGKSPTEEEFTAARRSGKPILVFTKDTDEPDEPRQREFKDKVEHYVNGRFRKSFTDPQDLNIAVLAALRDVTTPAAALRWEPVRDPVPMRWSWDVPPLSEPRCTHPFSKYISYRCRLTPSALVASRRCPRRSRVQRATTDCSARLTRWGPGNDGEAAWASVRETSRGGTAWNERRGPERTGFAVLATGQVIALQALPTDMLGALVDAAELHGRVARLLPVAAALLPRDSNTVAIAVAISPLDKVLEGDPSRVGQRSEAGMRMRQGLAAQVQPTATVSVAALAAHNGDVATDIAAGLLQAVRDAPR